MKSFSDILRSEVDIDSWEYVQGEIEIQARIMALDGIENASAVYVMYATVGNALVDYNFK